MAFTSSVFMFLFIPALLLCYVAASFIDSHIALGSAVGTWARKESVGIKNTVLLLFSAAFYGFSGISYLLLIVVSIVLNWVAGIRIVSKHGNRRTTYVLIIFFNLLLLFIFKYLNLVTDTFAYFYELRFQTNLRELIPKIALPVGISFYTFQIMSYQIDLYNGRVQCQRNLWNLALYVLLFPQLVAGPIVRYRDLEEEIGIRKISLVDIYEGVFRFIAGFSKKILLANTLGKAADLVFAMDGDYGVIYAVIGAVCYSIQLFLDFSAYSDMAIGLGRIFGFNFPENFNYPYLSKSITEFWRRWHISLSTWFRDYVFIPLGGSREGLSKNIRNILIVFAATGIWHGANWTFLFWGLYHAFFLILEKIGLGRILKKLPSVISRIYALIVVCIGFVFLGRIRFLME